MVYPIEVETRLAIWRAGAEGLSQALATGAEVDWANGRRAYDSAFTEMFAVPGGLSRGAR